MSVMLFYLQKKQKATKRTRFGGPKIGIDK
jgi:hypothetical protein